MEIFFFEISFDGNHLSQVERPQVCADDRLAEKLLCRVFIDEKLGYVMALQFFNGVGTIRFIVNDDDVAVTLNEAVHDALHENLSLIHI